MKKRNLISVFTFVLVILNIFTACGDLTEPDANSNKPGSDPAKNSNYTVKFEANGGTPTPAPQSITKGGKVVTPPAMTKTGYGFDGWYKDAACTNLWNFAADTVSGNITLYAKWDLNYHTVSFEANGGTPAPDPQNIAQGGWVVPPPAMTKTGYGFGGWYKEPACTNQWDFTADTVSGNITLYANWDLNYHTVSFDTNGGSPVPNPQSITNGGKVVMPPAMPKPGYSFGGWYKEESFTNQWNFDTDTVSGNITLYAKWDFIYHTVNFEANGGSPAPNPQSITKGGKVAAPSAMSRTGYGFDGWYKEPVFSNLWNFAADTVSDNITLYAKWDATTTDAAISTPGTTLADKLAWLKTNAERDTTYVLETSTAYEELPPQNIFYAGRNNITIRLKGIGLGRVIGLSDKGSLFTVGNGVTFILEENLILYGKDDNNTSLVQVNSGGTLIMNQSVKITSNSSSGVSVRGGTFTMSGGEISGNTAYSGGGGVSVSGGTFTMSGGEISGNTAYSGGGGVYVGGGIFEKTGGTIYGYTDGDSKSNVVKNKSGVIQNDKGHAVYAEWRGEYDYDTDSYSGYIKRKETTAGPTNNLSFNGNLKPPVWDGAWDF